MGFAGPGGGTCFPKEVSSLNSSSRKEISDSRKLLGLLATFSGEEVLRSARVRCSRFLWGCPLALSACRFCLAVCLRARCLLAACSLRCQDSSPHEGVNFSKPFSLPRARTPTAPRGVAQAIASRESPAEQGTPCTAGDRRLARRVPRPPLPDDTRRAGELPKKGRRSAGYLYIISIYLTRSAPCASRLALRASRFALRAGALRAARSALRASRSCASRAPERILSGALRAH